MSRKEQVKTGHPSRKSVSERLRFTSNAAEFTAATLDDWMQAERELRTRYRRDTDANKT
jgi:hypothetical protein